MSLHIVSEQNSIWPKALDEWCAWKSTYPLPIKTNTPATAPPIAMTHLYTPEYLLGAGMKGITADLSKLSYKAFLTPAAETNCPAGTITEA